MSVPTRVATSCSRPRRRRAPNLTREFVDKHKLSDDDVAAIARGEQPPPPVPGDADLYRTRGGWQSAPKGVKPEDVGKHAISR